MKLKVKDMDIATGDVQIVILNKHDAHELDLHPMDRVVVKRNGRKTVAILDIAESTKAVPQGSIGFFEETLEAIHAKHNDEVHVSIADKPESLTYIRKKLDGGHLNPKELTVIVQDIVENKLTDVELTSFVISTYTRGMNMQEIAALTKAMAAAGESISFGKPPIVDVHSIGGVSGNRTTMLIVPILVAAGCIVPKTSSRAITSPAGTADTMEVLCPVSLPTHKLKKIVADVGGFIIWGGAVNLAPADDRIIRVEHPLSIDAEGQMLASIMAKKASVGATHLLMEIPIGLGAKAKNHKAAGHLAKHFAELGNLLGINVKTVITEGSEPIGNGIGPILEAKDVIYCLKSDPRAPKDLIEKSIWLSGIVLEMVHKARKGHGENMARRLLHTGAALGAMTRIVEAQGGKLPDPDKLTLAKRSTTIHARKNGKVRAIPNSIITKVARLAGAPIDPEAGIFIHKHKGSKVKKGEPLITIYARSEHKLANALSQYNTMGGIPIT